MKMIVTSKHRVKKGNWSVEMSKAPYSKPYKLKISCLIVLPSKKSIQKPKQPQRNSISTTSIYFINR